METLCMELEPMSNTTRRRSLTYAALLRTPMPVRPKAEYLERARRVVLDRLDKVTGDELLKHHLEPEIQCAAAKLWAISHALQALKRAASMDAETQR